MQFRSEAGKTKWEFHYAFPDTAVRYTVRPYGFEGELACTLRLIAERNGSRDTVVDTWTAIATAQASRPPHQQFYSGIRTFVLPPGDVTVELHVRDVNDPSRELHSSFRSTVYAYGLKVDMSDVMCVQKMDQAPSAFTRNSVDAVPNPRHEFIGTEPALSIYGEVYNAKLNGIDTLVLEYEVHDYVNRSMFTQYRRMLGGADAVLYREDLSVDLLRSGVYTLTVSAKSKDLATSYASRREKFYILNPELPPEGELLLSEDQRFFASEWSQKTDQQLELELELARVLATNAEKLTMQDMESARAKQRFLFKFWDSRDPDPSTEANERLDEFRQMYKRAQTFYTSAMTRDGWRTDRGIILLRYGLPTQVEQFIQTMDTKPYEIWFYQGVQGGAYFYFVDWQVMQNHKLVHSTVIGEVKDDNWFSRWARAFSPDPNPIDKLLPTAR